MGGALPTPVAVVGAACLVAAVTDVWKFKVYNLLTLPLLLAGLVYHAATGGVSGLAGSAAGCVFGFAILFVFFVAGGMGGGDVKLMAAVGAWLGVPATFCVFLAGSLAAGVYALLLLTRKGRTAGCAAGGRVEDEVGRAGRRGRVIPFAAMLTAGLVVLILWAWAVNRPGV